MAVTAPRRTWWRRAWDLPVWAHLLALAAILLLLVPVVGTSQAFVADEGAAMIQARSLEAGDGWIVEHPLPEVDPDGRWYPVVNAERGEKGAAPLGKHPAYPLLAAAAARLDGVTGIVLLSLAGTVAAAGLAAALGGRFDRGLVRPTLWVVGLGSPMLFDGFLAMAHTLGAALATGALLAAVVAIQERRRGIAVLVAAPMAAAVLLRNEALLLCAALVLVAGVLAVRRRSDRWPAAIVAGSALAATIGARVLEDIWIAQITGGSVAVTSVRVPALRTSFVGGRVEGFVTTWLNPAYGGAAALRLALLVMLASIGWCAFRVRAHPEDRGAILGSAAVAAVAAVFALVVEPGNVVPGLLIAFPVATAGLLALRLRLFEQVGPAVTAATIGLFTLAVIATQYEVGGSVEWGGRYFALIVPAAVPLLLIALRGQGSALPAPVRRGVGVALATCALALSVMAVGGLRSGHQLAERVIDRIETAGRKTGDPRPVVLTTWVAGPRLAWPMFDGHRWLYVPEGDVATAAGRLRAAGIDRYVFITDDLEAVRPELAGLHVVSTDGAPSGLGYQILVIQS